MAIGSPETRCIEARGGDRQLLFCARRQQRGELAAGEMGDDVDRANVAGEAASDRRDRLVGRFVAVAAVELAEILDPDDRRREARVAWLRLAEARFERAGEGAPLRQAGGVADARRFVVGDNPHQTVGVRRAAARVGGPAAQILDRAGAAAGRREAIDGAIGRAVAAVAPARFLDREIARRRRVGGDEFGETCAGRQRARWERGERLGGVGAPRQAVADDVPIVDDRAQAIEGRARIKRERVGDARFDRFVSRPRRRVARACAVRFVPPIHRPPDLRRADEI